MELGAEFHEVSRRLIRICVSFIVLASNIKVSLRKLTSEISRSWFCLIFTGWGTLLYEVSNPLGLNVKLAVEPAIQIEID